MAESPNKPTPPYYIWSGIVAIFLLVFVAFGTSLSNGFSDFDDYGFLLERTQWRGLGISNLTWMFGTFNLGHYQPLTYVSYAIEWTIFGPNLDRVARAMHCTNLALHATTASLLWLLILRVLRSPAAKKLQRRTLSLHDASAGLIVGIAWIVALLWAIHPLRVESVVWLTERRQLLAGVFLVLAVHAYLSTFLTFDGIPQAPERSRQFRLLTHLLLLLSLLAKAWGMTFFLVALILDWSVLQRWTNHHSETVGQRLRGALPLVREKLGMIALCVLFALLAAAAQGETAGTVRTLAQWGPIERTAQACFGLCFYAVRTAWPADLSPLYELPTRMTWSEPRWILSIVAVAAAASGCVWLLRRGGKWGVATTASLACFLVIASPVLGVLQSGIQLAADRYSYFATMPLFVLAALFFVRLIERPSTYKNFRLCLSVLGVVAISAVFIWQSHGYSKVWSSTLDLWHHAIYTTKQTGPIVRNYYARQLEKASRPSEAVLEYTQSILLDSEYGDSYLGRAQAYKALDDLVQSERDLKLETQKLSDPTAAYLSLGLLYMQRLNRPQDGLAAFKSAAQATEAAGNPANSGLVYLNLAAAYGMNGREREAIEALKVAASYPDTRSSAETQLRDLGVAPAR